MVKKKVGDKEIRGKGAMIREHGFVEIAIKAFIVLNWARWRGG
jgi:hypothetical protein